MRVPRYDVGKELHDLLIVEPLHYTQSDWRKRNALYRRGLAERGVHLRRGVATILTVVASMTVRVAAHRVAALHRPFRRSHPKTIEAIRSQSDG